MSRKRSARAKAPPPPNSLLARRLGIEAPDAPIVFMRADCHVCRAEGFDARAQIQLSHDGRMVQATLFHVTSDLLAENEAGLSETAWRKLGLHEGDSITVSHPAPLVSYGAVRGKVFGTDFEPEALTSVIEDVVARRYSDIHLAGFVTACSARQFSLDEMTALTRAMIETGDRLSWDQTPIVDKHCVGGLPGNRTTPIVVSIVTTLGLTMPKTSSRAITSPAGTADTMETLAPVDLDLVAMRRVVEAEGGCIVWGGAAQLSPADDVLIRISRVLDFDGEVNLVASVLSKKIAAGASHLVLDLPIGPTAKIRSQAAAEALSATLTHVAEDFGLKLKIVFSDGLQPVGRGIGPALEARDVLQVLQGNKTAPQDLKARAVSLAGAVLELAGTAEPGAGEHMAEKVLEDGRAWTKFQQICTAQGGMRTPPVAEHRRPVLAQHDGRISAIDNRRLAKAAKLAGAPGAKAAGVDLHVRLGDAVERGQPLYDLHAETPGELDYAIEFVRQHPDIILLTSP